MANLAEDGSIWRDGVYQIETTDPALGGAPNEGTGAGIVNIPHKQLADRTVWLKTALGGIGGVATATPNPENSFDTISKGGIYTGQGNTTGNPVSGTTVRVLHIESPTYASQVAVTLTNRMFWRSRNNASGLWDVWNEAISNLGGLVTGDFEVRGDFGVTGDISFSGSASFDTVSHAFDFKSEGSQSRSTMRWLQDGVEDWRLVHDTNGDMNLRQPSSPANPGAKLLVNGNEVWSGGATTASVSATGYQKLPSGLILQWGSGTASDDTWVPFPIAFPNAVFSLVFGDKNAGPSVIQADIIGYKTRDTSGFTLTAYNSDATPSGGTGYDFFAIGR